MDGMTRITKEQMELGQPETHTFLDLFTSNVRKDNFVATVGVPKQADGGTPKIVFWGTRVFYRYAALSPMGERQAYLEETNVWTALVEVDYA